MKKNTSNKQRTGKGNRQEQEKGAFAFYIGIDLGDKYGEACVMNPAGEVHQQFRLRMKATELQAYFVAIGRSRVAVEAGGQSQWVAELIERCGHQVYVSNTPFHRALWRPDGGGLATAGTIASRAYAPKPGAPARPAIVREACQQLAGGRRTLEKRYLHKIGNTTQLRDGFRILEYC